jgi:hypothetical protein
MQKPLLLVLVRVAQHPLTPLPWQMHLLVTKLQRRRLTQQ